MQKIQNSKNSNFKKHKIQKIQKLQKIKNQIIKDLKNYVVTWFYSILLSIE